MAVFLFTIFLSLGLVIMGNVIIYNKMDNEIKFNYLLGDTAIL